MDKIKILLAEDHVVVRQSIRQFLDREPSFEVIGEASDGEEAVQLATQLKPDIIIMDTIDVVIRDQFHDGIQLELVIARVGGAEPVSGITIDVDLGSALGPHLVNKTLFGP